jgi:putative Holliday junction resolvase
MDELVAAIAEQEAERVVVGLPLTLRGEHGRQAQETLAFVRQLEARVDVEVETYDERFTTAMAERSGSSHARDAVAAAHLLEGYLQRRAG